ncbi:LysR family transcriptional regulator [Pseudomonas syringae]|uniref:LysR family transcriptional regulator n=1 Tax=Pseudomonas syringae TaxID=317 RepID=A0A085V8K5_PSESX|nr:LysR family transcriptional regulator [Pseudomonas syringae]KFE51768.1 LysR family transcriptional regulator [Pseudomonas syringae]
MADEINELRLLVQLVASGGLTSASIALNSSPPAISRRLAAMEHRLGVRLIDRHARRFRLTEEGARLHELALSIIADVEEAEAEISIESQPRGRLRVSVPVHIGRECVAPLVALFTTRFPFVSVELVLTDAEINLAEDEIDIALNVGQPTAQSVISRRLLGNRRVVCASPDYLKRMGKPNSPSDLLKHECILLVRGRRVFDRWQFRYDQKIIEIHVRGRMLTNSSEVSYRWALEGYGITMKAFFDIEHDLGTGRLVECLHEFASEAIDLYIVYGVRKHLPARARAFIDFLVKEFERD